MLTATVHEDTDIVEARLDGAFEPADVDRARSTIRAVAEHHGEARIVLEVGDVGRVDPTALWEDVRSFRLLEDISRVAVLTDKSWISTAVHVEDALLPVEMKVFEPGRRAEALAWLRT